MVLAGVWDIWYEGAYAIKSFSIITRPSVGAIKDISPRVPVIINDKEDQTEWLSETSLSKVQGIIDRKEPEHYQFYKISPDIQSIQKNDMSLHQALE